MRCPFCGKDETQVKRKLDHPHMRFVGRAVRKAFSIPSRNGKSVMRDFDGKVESYSEPRLLFKIVPGPRMRQSRLLSVGADGGGYTSLVYQ